MATGNTDDLKPIASPLDLSLKMANISKPMTDHESNDHKSVSSEELLSLKLLHDRLNKTMDLLLPPETLKKCEIKKSQSPSSLLEKTQTEIDYRKTMKTLLSFVESENSQSTDDDVKSMPTFLPNKTQIDAWTYWHDYILSLYLMNSSLATSILPPPPIPPPTSMSASFFQPPFNYLPPSPNSMLFHNMLNNIVNWPTAKTQDDCSSKYHQVENHNRDFGYKSKKLNSYFLKDSNVLYNSFSSSRNLGLTKSKLLDSPESFGVSLRGNQKYSIYYQQRPSNIFNNGFVSPVCSNAISTKLNQASTSKHSFSNDDLNKKTHVSTDFAQKKSLSLHKSSERNEPSLVSSKSQQNRINKFQNLEHGKYSCNNTATNCEGSRGNFENVPANMNLNNRYRETVFNCSCGQEFENLYTFTIHMKSTHHSPNSSKIERSIPKLVRGQDMWINSETEQTKEILRCMRCHQSFRTLPELTMHMVETNHYSEIVYSDTSKCVFLNADHDKSRPSYTTISSPISSPGGFTRKLKRTFSSSTGSDIGPEEFHCKRLKIPSPLDSLKDCTKDLLLIDTTSESDKISMNERFTDTPNESLKTIKKEVSLEVNEADSETLDPRPDSDGQNNVTSSKMFDSQESMENGTNSFNSVIRQIENFVEKSLPKPPSNEHCSSSSVPTSTNSNHKSGKLTGKCVSVKSNVVDRASKNDSKHPSNEKAEACSKNKDKVNELTNSLKYKTYPVSSSENLGNPLSSLQTLVETIQKNTAQTKDHGSNNPKVCASQNKETSSYSYPSNSPIVCDSLSQLQALVAGTSSLTTSTKQNGQRHLNYSFDERSQPFQSTDVADNSATLRSWCHKLGELLGLPQALSQAMLTQEAIKDLTNSVLTMNDNITKSSIDSKKSYDEDSNNNVNDNSSLEIEKIVSYPHSDSEKKPFQTRESDPIEQLKNLLNSTSDTNQSNHLQMMSTKFLGGFNLHANSPPAISKKAKCHFCNKPFANKGQVRLHISKGKCPSLLRSRHSSGNQFETATYRSSPPVTFDLNHQSMYKLKESMVNDPPEKLEHESNSTSNSRHSSTMTNKSVNLIREYFKFAKQMISNDANNTGSPPSKVENVVE